MRKVMFLVAGATVGYGVGVLAGEYLRVTATSAKNFSALDALLDDCIKRAKDISEQTRAMRDDLQS